MKTTPEELQSWLPCRWPPEQTYGCALPLWLRLRRYTERMHEWRKEPIFLPTAQYEALRRELDCRPKR